MEENANVTPSNQSMLIAGAEIDSLTGSSGETPTTISVGSDSLTGSTTAYTNTPNILQVTGQGEISVPTTLAEVQLGVQVQGETAGEVQEQLAQLSTSVVNVLQDLGAQELQTIDVQLNPVYSYENDVQTLIGYEGSNIVQFELPTEQAGAAIDAAVEAGANIVQNISFTASDEALQQAQLDALSEAVEDAQIQAGAVLNTLDLVPGEIVNIDINTTDIQDPSPLLFNTASAIAFDATTPILGGPQTVTANVSLDIVYLPDSAGSVDTAAF